MLMSNLIIEFNQRTSTSFWLICSLKYGFYLQFDTIFINILLTEMQEKSFKIILA